MLKTILKMVLIIIIGVDSRIVQRFTPDILDKIIRRFLADIWSKIPGENASATPTNNAHDIIHLLIREFVRKPHFREYIYSITKWLLNTISFIIHKIFTPKFATIVGVSTILIICCFRTLNFFLPLSTIII